MTTLEEQLPETCENCYHFEELPSSTMGFCNELLKKLKEEYKIKSILVRVSENETCKLFKPLT